MEINDAVAEVLNEGVGEHFKKHWKKYAAGAAVAGLAAAPELSAKYHGWRASKNFGKTVGSAIDGDNDKAEKHGEKTAEHMGKMVSTRNSKLNIARYLTKDRRAEGKMVNP